MFWAPLLLCFALAAPALSLGLGNHRPRLLKGRKPHYRRDGLNGTKGPTVQYPASPFFNQISGSKSYISKKSESKGFLTVNAQSLLSMVPPFPFSTLMSASRTPGCCPLATI